MDLRRVVLVLLLCGLSSVAAEPEPVAASEPVPAGIPEAMNLWLPGLDLLQTSRIDDALAWFLARHEERPDDVCGSYFPAQLLFGEELRSASYDEQLVQARTLLAEGIETAERTDSEEPGQRYCLGAIYGLRAYDNIEHGHHLRGAYDAKRARRIMRDLVKVDPSFVDCRFWLGAYDYFVDQLPALVGFFQPLLFLPRGDRDRGLEALEDVAHRGVLERFTTLWLLNDVYMMEGEPAKSLDMLERIDSGWPDYVWGKLELAQHLVNFEPRDRPRAIRLHEELLEQLESVNGEHVDALVHEVRISLGSTYLADLDPAAGVEVVRDAFTTARGDESNEFEAGDWLIMLLNRTARHAEAVEVAGQLEQRFPESERLPRSRWQVAQFDDATSRIYPALLPARRLVRDGRHEEAEAAFRRLLVEYEGSAQVHFRMGEAYVETERWVLAETHYLRVVESGQSSPTYLQPFANLWLGRICDLTDRRREAKEYYRTVRDNDQGYDGLGRTAKYHLNKPFRQP